MDILEKLTALRFAGRLERLVDEVAAQCRTTIVARVESRTASMGRAETRGYVRAHTARSVHQAVDLFLANGHGLPTWARAELVSRATERLMWQVSGDLFERHRRQRARRQAG